MRAIFFSGKTFDGTRKTSMSLLIHTLHHAKYIYWFNIDDLIYAIYYDFSSEAHQKFSFRPSLYYAFLNLYLNRRIFQNSYKDGKTTKIYVKTVKCVKK